ncbi:hypothetical protein PHYPO_G00101380 [Pangasianodon hypophthalmus]|uniref:Uncharacterized protein n=1 Tax=Pangasianodon hypophthalmus TaxID=310915 RepID=A0A5N5PY78_PANHP|nr:hypothetical protein PHYPO_G00101380 [Pangasianodon hypophthalmus]
MDEQNDRNNLKSVYRMVDCAVKLSLEEPGTPVYRKCSVWRWRVLLVFTRRRCSAWTPRAQCVDSDLPPPQSSSPLHTQPRATARATTRATTRRERSSFSTINPGALALSPSLPPPP